MRETILINALEWLRDNWISVINSEKYMNLGIEKIEKALSSAPESGGEETDEFIRDAVNVYWHQAVDQLNQKDLGDIERKNWREIKRKAHYFLFPKDGFIPGVQSSDVTPVASHTSTSSNSIEEEIFKALTDLINLKNYKEAHGKTSEYEEQQPKVWEAARQAIYKKLKNQHQTNSSLSKEEGKDELNVWEKRWTDWDMVGFAGYYHGAVTGDYKVQFTEVLKEYKERFAKENGLKGE